MAGITRVVEVADSHNDVVERGQRVAVAASRVDRATARLASFQRLPLSRASTMPRRRASRATAGSASRKANP